MKIKIKNIFNKKENDPKNITKLEDAESKEDKSVKRTRKGAYKENDKSREINIDLKKYSDNLFKNKNKLSKGYYLLLFFMVALGAVSVTVTSKAYNLFAKEHYNLYADTNSEDTISTMSKVEDGDNSNKNSKEEIKTDTNLITGTTSNNSEKTNTQSKSNTKTTTKTTNTVKPLSFLKPIAGDIQKPYSIDKVIYSKTLELWKTHDGIDISAKIGTSVKAIEKGTIEKVYDDSFYGITIVIDHGQGYRSSYSNLDKNTSVKEKQVVSKGQVIGKISNTSIGEVKDEPHLHFTLFKDNVNVDPTYIF